MHGDAILAADQGNGGNQPLPVVIGAAVDAHADRCFGGSDQ